MRFKITVVRHWNEYGELEVDAEDEQDAIAQAKEIMSGGDDDIEWSEMTSEDDEVESVEEI